MWSGDQGLNDPEYEDPEKVIAILRGEEDATDK